VTLPNCYRPIKRLLTIADPLTLSWSIGVAWGLWWTLGVRPWSAVYLAWCSRCAIIEDWSNRND